MDLFDPQYTTGQMHGELFGFDFVGTFVSIFGPFCMIVISIVGFFIVNASIFKNALDGLYATFPKWFDRVDEEKTNALTLASLGQGARNIANVDLLGLPLKILIRMTPNIKRMCNVAEGVQDPKSYFMKAIPIAVIQIFIGVFIWYGYTGEVGRKAAEFGTEFIDVVLLNVDPKAWVDNLPGEWGKPSISTDGSFADKDKVINAVSKQVYTAAVGEVSDISKENKTALASEIEAWVISCIDQHAEYTDLNKYDFKASARVELGAPNLEKVHGAQKDGNYQIAYATPISGFQTGTAINLGEKHIRFDVLFKEIAQKEVSLSNIESTLYIPTSSARFSGTNSLTISVGGYDAANHLFAMSRASGKVGNVEVLIEVVNGSNTINIKPATSSGEIPSDARAVTGIKGLSYRSGSNNNLVTSIQISGNETIFKPANGSINNWRPGEAPAAKEVDREDGSGNGSGQGSGDGGNNGSGGSGGAGI